MTLQSIKWDGRKITEPGMYEGISLDEYHAHDVCDGWSVSSSGLRQIVAESLADFFDTWRGNPNAEPEAPKRHFIVGRAAHHLHLGQKNFSSHFAVEPPEYEAEDGTMKKWNNNAIDCQAWHKTRRREGKDVLKPAEAQDVIRMAEALDRYPLIAHGALDGLVERSIFWRDDKTGIWLKARPDVIPTASGDFVDYKTCESVVYSKLMWAIEDHGYDQQGALVREAAHKVLGFDNPTFGLVFQQKKRPYSIRPVTLKEDTLNRGAKLNRIAIDLFAEALKTNHWPGPGGDREDFEYIELSDAAKKRRDDYIIINGGTP